MACLALSLLTRLVLLSLCPKHTANLSPTPPTPCLVRRGSERWEEVGTYRVRAQTQVGPGLLALP